MNKINFENLPSTNTPINATNMNLLQDNVENAINENITTDTETLANLIIDNKQIYIKKINIGTLPNNGRKTVNLGLSNIDIIVKIEGYASKDNGNDYMNIMQTTNSILYRKSTDMLFVDTNTDRSAYTGSVIVYYTKT